MSLENSSGRGVLSQYGTRESLEQYGGETSGENGDERVIEYVFDYNQLPAYSASKLAAKIPLGARITSATCDVITIFSSVASTFNVGLVKDVDGTAYDADGLIPAAQLTNAVVKTLVRTTGTGAVVNGVPLTEACQVYMVPTTDDFIAGRARLTIRYTQEPAA